MTLDRGTVVLVELDPMVGRELTVDHVPAERLGGNRLVLTCRRCNHESGAFLQDVSSTTTVHPTCLPLQAYR